MIAFYAGSFDPFTFGHWQVIRQAAKIFTTVRVGLGTNPNKKRRTDAEAMAQVMRQLFARENLNNLNNIEVQVYQGLTTAAATAAGAAFLIRGLRYNGMDYDYEENLAAINFKLAGLETIYFRAGDNSFISSSMIIQLHQYGVALTEFIPPEVEPLLPPPKAAHS